MPTGSSGRAVHETLTIAPGSNGFTLVVTGAGFVNGCRVNWNGTPLTSSFARAGQVKALVPKSKVTAGGAALIMVVNPEPGGGTSNAVPFEITAPLSTVMFAGQDSATDAFPNAIVTADFNHDRKLDMVTANGTLGLSGPGTISVLLGNGNGTFQNHVEYAATNAGEATNALVAGDFNGDGNLDILVGGGRRSVTA